MRHCCSLWNELEFLSVEVLLSIHIESYRLILRWFLHLHRNLAASDWVIQIFSKIILSLRYCPSLHLGQLFGLKHPKRLCDINRALLEIVGCLLFISFDRTVIPAGVGSWKEIWLLICPTTHLQWERTKLGPFLSIYVFLLLVWGLEKACTLFHNLRTALYLRICLQGLILDGLG